MQGTSGQLKFYPARNVASNRWNLVFFHQDGEGDCVSAGLLNEKQMCEKLNIVS